MSEINYATNGKGNLGVTLGAIGTGLGAIGSSGLLDGVLGGRSNGGGFVGRETFDLQNQLAEANNQNSLLKAELNTEKKMVEVFNSLNDKINAKVDEQNAINAAQAVTNCNVASQLAVANNNINQLMGLTKLAIPSTNIFTATTTSTT